MRRSAVVAAVSGLLLAGCGGGTPSTGSTPAVTGTSPAVVSPSSSGTTATTPSPTNYLQAGQEVLTPPGTNLRLGQAATVAWKPSAGKVAVAKVAVTAIEQAPLSTLKQWTLPQQLKQASVYFVHLSVRNLGRLDLGGLTLPVYAGVDQTTLVQSSRFAGTFQPCPSGTLGKHLRKGAKQQVCLLYLLPDQGTLKFVAFRPMADVALLTWQGDVTRWQPPTKKKRH